MIITFDGGSFKHGVTVESLELSHCYPFWLYFSSLRPGPSLPAQERGFPLGSRLPLCFDSDPTAQELLFLCSLEQWVGELRDTPGLLYSQFPSLPGLPGEVKSVINSDFSHLVDELRHA